MMMLRSSLFGVVLALWAASAVCAPDYPVSPRGEVVDDYHGTRVADPYRWLEDPNSAATRAWIDEQNALTQSILARLPERKALRDRLSALWNFPRANSPIAAGPHYFYRFNDGLQDQSVVMVRKGLSGSPRVLIDPNTMTADGTVTITDVVPSPDGRLLAYGLSEAGSDWKRFEVMDVASGRKLDAGVSHIKFSTVSWTHDNQGYFYSRYPAPEGDTVFGELRDQKLYYHRIGTAQRDDLLIMASPHQPQWGFDPYVSSDGHQLVVVVWRGSGDEGQVHVMDLKDPLKPDLSAQPLALVSHFEAAWHPLGRVGRESFFLTTDQAPRGRVVAVELADPARPRWREVLAAGPSTIETAALVGKRLVVAAMVDAVHQLTVHDLQGKRLRQIATPGPGSVSGLSGRPGHDELFFSYESYLQADTIYRTTVEQEGVEEFHRPVMDFDASRYVTEQIFYRSRDGTRVPMFITHRKGLVRNGQTPAHLYGYGGFNVSLTPRFRVSTLVWLERGGIHAVANLRGGGEYGKAWHEAGTKQHKQNVFDDFIAAAEYLVDLGWTAPERLAISGGSNGGLLVGAVLNQRPDLFAAALPAVGVMDMLRFHKFTIGWAWTGDYGSSDDADGFRYLFAYSPYHQLRPGTHYPAVLITTADHDDRVVPGHSFKYAAGLQHAQAADAPALIRIGTRAGHGAGMPVSKRIQETADRLAFMAFHTGLSRSRTPWRRLYLSGWPAQY